MRITCPICGARDRREFYYKGEALALNRPDPEAGEAAWDDYIHNRDNPAGVRRELWYHVMGCSAWIVVTRNTSSHEILETALASDVVEAAE